MEKTPDSDLASICQRKSRHRRMRWVSLDPSPRRRMKLGSSRASTHGPYVSPVLAKPGCVRCLCERVQTKGTDPAQRGIPDRWGCAGDPKGLTPWEGTHVARGGGTDLSTALWTPARFPSPLSRAYPRIKITGTANLCEKVFSESMGRTLLPRGSPLSACLIANRRLDPAAPLL